MHSAAKIIGDLSSVLWKVAENINRIEKVSEGKQVEQNVTHISDFTTLAVIFSLSTIRLLS